MKVLKFLFFCLCFFWLFGELFRFDLGNTVIIKPLDIVVGLLNLIWLPYYFFFIRKATTSEIPKIFFLFPAIGFISLIINSVNLKSEQFFISIMYLIRWIMYINVIFIVKNFNKEFKKTVLTTLIFLGAINVFIGFIQYFYYLNLRNLYYLGWDEHMYRLFSTFLDPNYIGAFYVMYFLLLFGLFFDSLEKKKNINVLTYSFLIILTLSAIFLTYSRSAMLMLFIGIITFLIIKNNLKWILILFAIFILIFLFIPRNFNIENMNPFRIASSEARLDSAKIAIKIIKENPIIGVGFNAYRYALLRYGYRNNLKTLSSHADAGTDNSYLFVLATTGMIGFVSFVLLWFRIIQRTFVTYKNKADNISLVMISSCLGLLADSIFINSLFYMPIILWLWILIGITDYI